MFFSKTLDIITVFHKASSPASVRVASLLKTLSANSTAGASASATPRREPFELNVTEDAPTEDQVKTILEYVGPSGISQIIKEANNEKEALKKFKESNSAFVRPVVVDWNNGKAIAGDNESEILKILNAQKNASTFSSLSVFYCKALSFAVLPASNALSEGNAMAPSFPGPGRHQAPVFNQANIPRVYANDRPPGQRAVFNKFYPNGLPILYRMLETPGSQGVMETYVEDHLPVGFYTKPKSEAKAIFSTQNGTRPFKSIKHADPQRRIHLWSKDEIQAACNSLRKIYWDHMKEMGLFQSWDDLWKYFDADDLYKYGALNLWNVINTLHHENQLIKKDVLAETAVHIGYWADKWAESDENKTKLIRWDESQGPVIPLLSMEDWQSIGNVNDDAMPLIANALKHRRALLLAGEGLGDHTPTDLMTSCRNNELQNWLGEKVFQPNGLPSPPEVRSHHCSPASRNAPPPVYTHNGAHYYMPPPGWVPGVHPMQSFGSGCTVEALQKSAAAAGAAPPKPPKPPYNGIVIANGSSRPLPPPRSRRSRSASDSSSQDTASKTPSETSDKTASPSEGSVSPPAQPLDDAGDAHSITPPMPNSNVGPIAIHVPEEYDAYTPTKVKRQAQDNSRARSLPPSAILDYSELTTNPTAFRGGPRRLPDPKSAPEPSMGFGTAEVQGPFAPPRGLEADGEQRSDQYMMVVPQQSSPPYPPNPPTSAQGTIPTDDGTHDRPMYNQSPPFTTNSSGPMPYAAHGQAETTEPQPLLPTHGQLGRRQHMPPPPKPVVAGFPPCRTYVNNRINNNEPQWSTNKPPNREAHVTAPTPNRNGSQRGQPRPPKGNRRGQHDQRNATLHAFQTHGGQGMSSGNNNNNNSWRRQSVGSQQPRRNADPCPNDSGHVSNEYVPCNCFHCNNRNRSVFVRVNTHRPDHTADIKTHLKFGLADRFGNVEEVYQTPSSVVLTFIVRFFDEHSVGQALAFSQGDLPEKALSVSIQPVLKSKWIGVGSGANFAKSRKTSAESHHSRNGAPEQLSFPQFGYAHPSMDQPLPMAHPGAAGGVHLGYLTLQHGQPSVQVPNMHVGLGGFAGQPLVPTGGNMAQPGFARPFHPVQPPYPMQPFHDREQAHQRQRTGSFHQQAPAVSRPTTSKKSTGQVEASRQTGEPVADAIHHSVSGKPDSDSSKGPTGKHRQRGSPKKPVVDKPRSDLSSNSESSSESSAASDVHSEVKGESSETKHQNDDAVSQVEEKRSEDVSKTDSTDGPGLIAQEVKPEQASETTSSDEPSLTAQELKPEMATQTQETQAERQPVPQDTPSSHSRLPSQPSHTRTPSLYTHKEINERRREWARIPMPLDPRKVSAASAACTCKTDTKPDSSPPAQKNDASSDDESEKSACGPVILTPETGSSVNDNSLDGNSVVLDDPPKADSPSHSPKGPQKALQTANLPVEHDAKTNTTPTTTEPTMANPPPHKGKKRNKYVPVAIMEDNCHRDRSGQNSRVSTPVSMSSSTSTKPAEGESASNQSGEGTRKNKKKSNKKWKQNNEGRVDTLESLPAGIETALTSLRRANGLRDSSGQTFGASSYHSVPRNSRPSSRSPTKRLHAAAFQQSCHEAARNAKLDRDQSPPAHSNNLSTQDSAQNSQSMSQEGPGRSIGFRQGAGGSLRMGKKRKGRPLVTQPSVAEERLDTRVAPPSSDVPFDCSNGAKSKDVNVFTNVSTRFPLPLGGSRLNPRAKDFTESSSPILVDAGSRPPLEAKNDKKAPHDEQQNTEANDSSSTVAKKTNVKTPKRGKGKGKDTPTPEQPQEPKTPGTEKKANVTEEDWPSLPAPRERALSKSSTPSLWGKKSPGSKGTSPINR
ncbi:hypothetical protein B0T10DRAFT_607197 [Thelonectria olida]|uniref:Uncharacterized protein n=1 Tax=Thelonectria olida TaxID=1576542 RepID=A0A9P8W523_9HYPO|nr:hypothetical protein B0T10DRAFT_607197 [Thelonectria olida]